MDPQACWQRIFDAFEEQNQDEALDACEDLAKWIRKGGTMPTIQRYELEFLLQAVADQLRP
jgi:hypothetical protein